MRSFTLNADVDTNGTFLIKTLPGLSARELKRVFGPPNRTELEEEKGYGDGYVFESNRGEPVTLYPRYGVWRIGARDPKVGAEFELRLCHGLERLGG